LSAKNKQIIETMKRISLAVLLFMIAVACGYAAKKTAIPSSYAATFPVNDTVRWQDNMTPVADGKAFVRMFNNGDALFFQVLVKDRGVQMRMLNQGLTLYLDLNGKDNKKYSILFPAVKRDNMKQGKAFGDNQRQGRRGQAPECDNMQAGGDMPMMPDSAMMQDGMQRPQGGQHGHGDNREMRVRMLKRMISSLSGEPIVFKTNEDESLMSEGTVQVRAMDTCLLYSGIISYSKLGGKLGGKGEISLGMTCTPNVTKSSGSDDDDHPEPPDGGMGGGPGGGMMGGPGGGMMGGPGGGGPGGGGMMGGPGFGGGQRGEMGGSRTKAKTQTFSEWLNFAAAK
jgi:hypothetical protein